MFGEHIEAMADLYADNDEKITEANLHDFAMAVADIAYAQGMIDDETEIDLAVEQIMSQARYTLSL